MNNKTYLVGESTIDCTHEEYNQIKRFMDEQDDSWPVVIEKLNYTPFIGKLFIKDRTEKEFYGKRYKLTQS